VELEFRIPHESRVELEFLFVIGVVNKHTPKPLNAQSPKIHLPHTSRMLCGVKGAKGGGGGGGGAKNPLDNIGDPKSGGAKGLSWGAW
jgi:hypothetical protein